VILLACDLDNTLIHSQERPGDICVGYKNGKPHVFISSTVCRCLEELDPDICFVPVTGKYADQYRRIRYFETHVPPYALTSCGGVLFRAGTRDPLWRTAFHPLFEETSEAMQLCLDELLSRQLPQGDISWAKWVDRIFIASQASGIQGIVSLLSTQIYSSALEFFAEDDRLYVFPRGFNKGSAVDMLRRRLRPELLICAGDGLLDLPMLCAADIALVPNERLARQVEESPAFRGKLHCFGREGTGGGTPADFAEYVAGFVKNRASTVQKNVVCNR
jgi:hydroxymethylpyrimidine pyrophosphatase-like HAD family hydrolase